MTMIENSDRGITLAKPLAWSILVALIAGGIWVGVQIGTLSEVQRQANANTSRLSALNALPDLVRENASDIRRLTERQRSADLQAVRIDSKLATLLEVTARIEKRLEAVEADDARRD